MLKIKKIFLLFVVYCLLIIHALAGEIIVNNQAEFDSAINTNPAFPVINIFLNDIIRFDQQHNSAVDNTILGINISGKNNLSLIGGNLFSGTNAIQSRMLTDTSTTAVNFSLNYNISEQNVSVTSFSVLGGNSTSANNTRSSYGGAVYSERVLDVSATGSGILNISSNGVKSGDALTGYSSAYSAYGGAMYSNKGVNLSRGRMLLENNIAIGGSSSNAMSDTSYSGYGGAIASELTTSLSGDIYLIRNNMAVGGNATNGASSMASGYGGAIYSLQDFKTDALSYRFINNKAIGGSADRQSNSSISGLGGAIYSSGNISLTTGEFIGNQAGSKNTEDLSSGRGGAIFHDSKGNNVNFQLTATKNKDIVFSNNAHRVAFNNNNEAISAGSSNSIYFGNTSTVNDGKINAVFNVGADGNIFIYDGLESQADNFTSSVNTVYKNLDLSLIKTGAGNLVMGGVHRFGSGTTFDVQEGALRLLPGSQLILNNNRLSSFSIGSGAILYVDVNQRATNKITANTINIVNGARLAILGISSLKTGSHIFQDALVASSGSVAGLGTSFSIDNVLVKASYDLNGVNNNYNLVIKDLKNLSDVFPEISPAIDIIRLNPNIDNLTRLIFDDIYMTGRLAKEFADLSKIIDGYSILSLANTVRSDLSHFRSNILHHQNIFRFAKSDTRDKTNSLAIDNQEIGSQLPVYTTWANISSRWSSQQSSSLKDGYDYNPHSLTIGLERSFSNWLVGIAGQYNDGELRSKRGQATSIKSKSFNSGIYASYNTPSWFINLGAQYFHGWNKSLVNYEMLRQSARGSLSSNAYSGSIDFGYTFDLEKWGRFTPYLGVNYDRIELKGFTETGSLAVARQFSNTKTHILETPIGITISKDFIVNKDNSLTKFTPFIDFKYKHNFADRYSKADISYVGIKNLKWQSKGLDSGRYSFSLNTGINARVNNRIDVGINYILDIKEKYFEQQVNLGLAVGF